MSESSQNDLPTLFGNFRKCSEKFGNPRKILECDRGLMKLFIPFQPLTPVAWKHWYCAFCSNITLFTLVLHFLHWCYSSTALLSANQNRVIFSCMLLRVKSIQLKCFMVKYLLKLLKKINIGVKIDTPCVKLLSQCLVMKYSLFRFLSVYCSRSKQWYWKIHLPNVNQKHTGVLI